MPIKVSIIIAFVFFFSTQKYIFGNFDDVTPLDRNTAPLTGFMCFTVPFREILGRAPEKSENLIVQSCDLRYGEIFGQRTQKYVRTGQNTASDSGIVRTDFWTGLQQRRHRSNLWAFPERRRKGILLYHLSDFPVGPNGFYCRVKWISL